MTSTDHVRPRAPWLTRLLRRAAGGARVTLYFGLITAALTTATAGTLRASLRESTFQAARSLAALDDLTGDAATVVVNGARFHRASNVTRDGVPAVLDRYARYCDARPGPLARALAARPEAAAALPAGETGEALGRGILRESDGDRGLLVCFAEEGDGPRIDLGEALDRVGRRGDLTALGRLRYLFVERRPDGTSRATTLWTDDPLVLATLFPTAGDAPGDDSALVPRPPDSRRVLTSRADGLGHAARVYETSRTPGELRGLYTERMEAKGLARAGGDRPEGVAFLRKDGLLAVIGFAREDGKTYVSVVETSPPETATGTSEPTRAAP